MDGMGSFCPELKHTVARLCFYVRGKVGMVEVSDWSADTFINNSGSDTPSVKPTAVQTHGVRPGQLKKQDFHSTVVKMVTPLDWSQRSSLVV